MVIDPTTLSGDKVVFGATVHLLDENDNKIVYQIVGQTEADAKIGRISYHRPLGRALIGPERRRRGRGVGPVGDKYYEIEKVEFI
jgi:transcription elongation factor GreA